MLCGYKRKLDRWLRNRRQVSLVTITTKNKLQSEREKACMAVMDANERTNERACVRAYLVIVFTIRANISCILCMNSRPIIENVIECE